MADDPKDPGEALSIEQLEQLASEAGAPEMPKAERLQKTSHVAQLMCHDLVDKLRYWEKETLALPEDQLTERLSHLTDWMNCFRETYMTFADQDL